MNGVVTGGWEFVIAAYVLTGLALATYGVMVVTRVREQYRRSRNGGASR